MRSSSSFTKTTGESAYKRTGTGLPVPLNIFRSNSKFDENSERSSFDYTRHDSDTVVTCAKYRCDRPRIFYTKVFGIFIEFRIRSKLFAVLCFKMYSIDHNEICTHYDNVTVVMCAKIHFCYYLAYRAKLIDSIG